MKMPTAFICLFIVLTFAPPATMAQTTTDTQEAKHIKAPYTPAVGSTERKNILAVLRKTVHTASGLDVIFVVNYLKINQGWAWVETFPQSKDGLSHYEDLSGLLHKTHGQWEIAETRPCCGECADDPECADNTRYFKQLKSKYPTAPANIFPDN